jgi:hypothetical protein
VLTAAHCANQWDSDETAAIRFGGRYDWDHVDHDYWRGTVPVYRVANWYPHPDWNPPEDSPPDGSGTDLMILELESDVADFEYEGRMVEVEPWPLFVASDAGHLGQPVPEGLCIGPSHSSWRSSWVRHVGYGNRTGYVQGEIKTTSLAQTTRICASNSEFDTDGHCQGGDSGSPVIQYRAGREVVVGVVVQGQPGEVTAESINPDNYEWIHSVVALADPALLPTDYDSDGISNLDDNCPLTSGLGSDDDLDGDNVGDGCDNCALSNGGQMDVDGDGIARGCDNCRDRFNPAQTDSDEDMVGDLCDNCPTYNPGLEDPQLQDDIDEDGLGDACDNCVEEPNPNQANCDEHDDIAEGVEFGWQGDACDPDLCVEIEGGTHFSDELFFWDDLDATLMAGRIVSIDLRALGGEATTDDPPRYAEDASGDPIDVIGDIEVAFCECEPHPTLEGHCLNETDCPLIGGFTGGWRELSWSSSEYGFTDRGIGIIPDMWFSHPSFGRGRNNTITLNWDWRTDADASPTHVIIRLRPHDWPLDKGNTFTELLELEVTSSHIPRVPADLLHPPEHLYAPPSLDFKELRICPSRGPCPWYNAVTKPFEMPDVLAVAQIFDAPFTDPVISKEKSKQVVIGTLAMRDNWKGSSVVAGSLFMDAASKQLDIKQLANSVMFELQKDFQPMKRMK